MGPNTSACGNAEISCDLVPESRVLLKMPSLAFYAPESLERPSDEAYAAVNELQEFSASRIEFCKRAGLDHSRGSCFPRRVQALACLAAAPGSALISTLRGNAAVAMGAVISRIPLRYSAFNLSLSMPSGSRMLRWKEP